MRPIAVICGIARQRFSSVSTFALAAAVLIPAGTAQTQSVSLDELGVLPPATRQSPQLASVRSLLSSGQLEAAEKQLAGLAQSGFPEAEIAYWRGVLELRRGNGYDAIRQLRHAQKLSHDPHPIASLALAYYSVGQFHLFESFMLQAVQRLPDAFAPHYYLGRYYATAGVADFARAREHLARSIQLNPTYFRSYYYLGYCHEAEKHFDEAQSLYQKSMHIAEPEGHSFVLPYEGMARILNFQDRLQAAQEYAAKAAALAPREPEAHKIMAEIYERQQRSELAAQEWETAATLDPADSVAQYRLFRLYTSLGKKELAALALRQYKRLVQLYGSVVTP